LVLLALRTACPAGTLTYQMAVARVPSSERARSGNSAFTPSADSAPGDDQVVPES